MVATPNSKPRQQAPEPQPCCRGHCSGLGETPLCSLISLVTRMTCELGHILTLQGALIIRDCLPRPHSFLPCMPPCLMPGLRHSLCPTLLAVPLYIIRDWITKLIFIRCCINHVTFQIKSSPKSPLSCMIAFS